MRPKSVFCLLALLVVMVTHAYGQAAYDPYGPRHLYLCIDKFFEVVIPPEAFPPIPVGCEVIDCCPGCPAREPIDWRIKVDGTAVSEVLFEFKNLDPMISKKTSVEGKGFWAKPNILSVCAGEVVLRGLMAPQGGRVPIAFPKIIFDKEILEKNRAELDASGDDGKYADYGQILGEVELSIEAFQKEYSVYEYTVIFVLRWCESWIPATRDWIDLDNNAGLDNAVILVDGRRSNGCVDDLQYRATDRVTVGNLLTETNCHSDVVVFSDDDAMQLHEDVTTWTDAIGDVHRVDQTPDILNVPVSIWLLTNDAINTVGLRAQNEIAQAAMLYNTNNCGITFNPNIQDVSNINNAVNLVGVNNAVMCAANWINNLTASAYYTANQINVYYVNGAFTGLNCIADRNIIVIGTTAQVETLAHEIGHTFSLDHTNATVGIPAGNLMVGGGVNRTNITEGQCFRCNVDVTSVLNTNGVRTGPTRNCPHGADTDECPPVTLDVIPN